MEALFGGIVVGLGAGGYLYTQGRVLGCSGQINGLATGRVDNWYSAVAFIVAFMICGFLFDTFFFHSTFRTEFISRPSLFYLFCGIIVGFGTKLANGCTSGHGLAGMARMSVRSMVATLSFMIAGFFSANLFNGTLTWANLSNISVHAPQVGIPQDHIDWTVFVLGVSSAALGFITSSKAVTSLIPSSQIAAAIPTFFFSAAFACGLGFGGMAVQDNIIGAFLLPNINANLWITFMAAVPIAFTLNNLVPGAASPACPMRRDITPELIFGSVLFGIGWGMGGFCPGPYILNSPRVITDFATNGSTLGVFVIGALLGPWLALPVEDVIAKKRASYAALQKEEEQRLVQ